MLITTIVLMAVWASVTSAILWMHTIMLKDIFRILERLEEKDASTYRYKVTPRNPG